MDGCTFCGYASNLHAENCPEYKIIRRCMDCRYVSEERPQRDMITPILFCRHGPMQPLVIGMGANGTPVIRALAPAVAPDDWCYRFETRTLPPH